MNERLNIQDFIDLLAEKHGMNKQDADGFVKEFFLLIEQALESDQCVKIKGLGTFKLINVDSRESINVNTGERFQIEGHTKVSFTPDPTLRDVVNKPFAHFETVILNQNTILEDTPMDEMEEDVDEMAELAGDSMAEKPVAEGMIKEEATTEEVAIEAPIVEEVIGEEVVVEAPVIEEPSEPIVETIEQMEIDPVVDAPTELTSAMIEPVHKPTAEEIIAAELQQSNAQFKRGLPEELKPKPVITQPIQKSPIFYLVAIIILALLFCGSALLFIYYPDLLSPVDKKELAQIPAPEPIVQREIPLLDTVIAARDTVAEVVLNEKKEVVPQEPVKKLPEPVKTEMKAPVKVLVKAEPKASAKTATPVKPDSVTYKITGTKATHTVKEGETLTRVSLRFYGTKDLWPYIVQHNRNIIKNPDKVPYGTTLKIPELVKR